MIGEAVDTAHRIILAAALWAGAIGGAVAFTAVVVAFSVGPLIAPRSRRPSNSLSARLTAVPGESVPREPRTPEKRSQPRWAHPPRESPEPRKPPEAA